MEERHAVGATGADADAPVPSQPASDPDYSPLQTEAGHASENPVTGGSWPQPGEDTTSPAERDRDLQADVIDPRAADDTRRTVRSRERPTE